MRNLKQSYKHIKDNNCKTGRGRKSWEYFDILDEIYGKNAAVVLPHVVQTLAFASASEVMTPATLESESETVVADGKTTPVPFWARCDSIERNSYSNVDGCVAGCPSQPVLYQNN